MLSAFLLAIGMLCIYGQLNVQSTNGQYIIVTDGVD